jgi:5-methylcytosine-specific restriction endonuclease McrA
MALITIKPSLHPAIMHTAKPQPKDADPYYRSKDWRVLRAQVLTRDHYQCTAPDCKAKASVVDHITSRRNGGTDTMSNLRSLCQSCDSSIKELASGQRRKGWTPT